MKRIRIQTVIYDVQHEALKALKEKTGDSTSWHIRKAIDAYLKKMGVKCS